MATKVLALVLLISSMFVIYSFTKAKYPVQTAFKSALSGISAVLLVNMTATATGCYIIVNYFTVFIATILSLPGVIGLLLLNIVFI